MQVSYDSMYIMHYYIMVCDNIRSIISTRRDNFAKRDFDALWKGTDAVFAVLSIYFENIVAIKSIYCSMSVFVASEGLHRKKHHE